MDAPRRAHRPPLQHRRVHGPPRGRAGASWSWARGRRRRGDGRPPRLRAASGSGCCRCGSTGRSRPQALLAALPATVRGSPCSTGPRSPARSGSRSSSTSSARWRRRTPTASATACPRVIGGRYGLSSKEFTPAMVAGVLRGAGARAARGAASRSASTTTSRGTSLAYDPAFDIEPADTRARGVLRPRLRRDGRREQEHDQDPRRRGGPARPGLLRLRLEEVGVADRVPPALRPAADPGALPRRAGELRRLPPLRAARSGRGSRPRRQRRDAAAQLPARAATSCGRRCSRPIQEQILAKRIELYVDRRQPDRPRGGPRRAHQHRAADLLLRHLRRPGARQGDRPDQGGDRQELRPARRGGGRGEHQAPSIARWTGLERVEIPARATSTITPLPIVAADAPEFVRNVTAMMMAGRGDELPVSALPADGTWPSGTAAYEKRNVSDSSRSGTPELCIQCGNCSFVCPHSVIRSKFYEESQAARGAPAGFRSAPLRARGLPDTRYTLQVYVEDCTGCGLCVEACPVARAGATRHARRSTWRERRAAGRPAERENIAFFETLPVDDRLPRRLRHGARRPSSSSRCSSSPAPARAAARHRTSSSSPSSSATALHGRQRDRLLIDLRRQPAHDAVDDRRRRARSGLVELAVRGQCRVRPRPAPRRRPPRRAGTATSRRTARRARRRNSWTRFSRARQLTESELEAQRDRVAELERRLDGMDGPVGGRPDERRRPPRPAQRLDRRRRRLGLRHRIRRSRPRPGQRPQHQRPRPRHRGLLQHRRPDVEGDAARCRGQVRRGRQDGGEEGPRHAGDRLRQRLRGPRRDGRRRRSRRCAHSARRRRTTARPSSSPTATASPTASRCATGSISSTARWPAATGRSIRYDPMVRAAGGNPFLLDSPRPRIALADYTQPGAALRDPRQLRPRRGRAPGRTGRGGGRASDGTTYEEMATRAARRFPADARKER